MCSLSKEKCLLFIFHSLTLSLCISLNFRLHLSLCFSHSFRLTHWKLSSSLSMCVSLFFDSNALQAFVHVEKANPVILRLCEDSKTKLRIPNLQNIQKIKNYKHKQHTRSHILAISLAPTFTNIESMKVPVKS